MFYTPRYNPRKKRTNYSRFQTAHPPLPQSGFPSLEQPGFQSRHQYGFQSQDQFGLQSWDQLRYGAKNKKLSQRSPCDELSNSLSQLSVTKAGKRSNEATPHTMSQGSYWDRGYGGVRVESKTRPNVGDRCTYNSANHYKLAITSDGAACLPSEGFI